MDIINERSQEQTHFSMNQINEIQDKFNVTEDQFENITNQNSPITAADYSFSSLDSLAVEPDLSLTSHFSCWDAGTQGSVLGGIVLAGFVNITFLMYNIELDFPWNFLFFRCLKQLDGVR